MAAETVLGASREDRGLTDPLGAMRAELGTVAVLLGVAGLAWWSTAERMAGMNAGPGSDLGAVGWFTGVWAVMMAAMMLPSLAPTAAVYAALMRREPSRVGSSRVPPSGVHSSRVLPSRVLPGRVLPGRVRPSRVRPSRLLLFAAGYLLVWSAAGVLAYGSFELGKGIAGGALAWHAGGRWLAVGVLALAALYQLTSFKRAFLHRCRSPLRFLRTSWREDRAGSFAMGLRSGGWCLGCSWALMAALFALGVMSLFWMALIAGLVALEKVGPWGRAAKFATAGVLVVLAIAILIAPHEVPGFVVPGSGSGPSSGSSGSMHAMKAMGSMR